MIDYSSNIIRLYNIYTYLFKYNLLYINKNKVKIVNNIIIIKNDLLIITILSVIDYTSRPPMIIKHPSYILGDMIPVGYLQLVVVSKKRLHHIIII